MEVLSVCNPNIVAEVMQKSFEEMDSVEYTKTLNRTLARAKQFIASDDSKFSSSLTVQEGTTYADYVRTFLRAVRDLETAPRNHQKISAAWHARVIAWWQVLSTFRTLHEGPALEE